ncbi:unnamed protein product [[Candida] boidinii]|uniref:Unnamed protein product n=1 Tax=Candida boidinii TaxID=5477 RepID=A0ACB5TKF5_CANBO|nr:unnamed protein product [[Candida] boidinii]
METVRVDATLLQQYTGRTIRIIGKLEDINYQSNKLTINSNGKVILNINDSQLDLIKNGKNNNNKSINIGTFIEIIGFINNDLTIKVIQFFDFGDNLNEDVLNKLTTYIHKVPELFHET